MTTKKISVLFFPKVPNEMIRNISTFRPKNRFLQKGILFFEVKQPKDSGSLRYERVAERFSRMPSFLSGRCVMLWYFFKVGVINATAGFYAGVKAD